MRNPQVLSLAAIVVSLVALAVVFLNLPAPETTATGPAAGSGRDVEQAALEARLDSIDEELRDLQGRMLRLELRPSGDSRQPTEGGAITPEEFDALRRDVQDALAREPWLTDRPEGATGPTPEFTELVQESLAEIRRQEEIQRIQGWAGARSERLAQKMPYITEHLGLAPYQEQALQTALGALYERQAGMALRVTSGETSRQEIAPHWQGAIDAFLVELGGFLTPEQLQAYQGLSGDLFPGGNGRKGK